MNRETEKLRNLASRSNDGDLAGPALNAADTIDRMEAEMKALKIKLHGLGTEVQYWQMRTWIHGVTGESSGLSYDDIIEPAALVEREQNAALIERLSKVKASIGRAEEAGMLHMLALIIRAQDIAEGATA